MAGNLYFEFFIGELGHQLEKLSKNDVQTRV